MTPMTCTLALLAFASAPPLLALAAPPPSEPPAGSAPPGGETPGEAEAEIIITAPQERGAVIGRSIPDIRLERGDIATYGAGNVSELLTSLQPQTGERPVVLVNGRRISGLNEVNRLPPEAIERIDILPPEVALAYGYRADQRVVNIVLETRFHATTMEVEGGMATEGGRGEQRASVNWTRIRNTERVSLEAEYGRRGALYESERGLSGPENLFDSRGNITAIVGGAPIDPALSALAGREVIVAGVPAGAADAPPALADFLDTADRPGREGDGRYRTLLPATQSFAIGATFARPVGGGIAATLSGRYTHERSDSAFGLPAALLTLPSDSPFSPFSQDVALYRSLDTFGALAGSTRSDAAQLGLVLNGRAASWNWSFTAGLERSRTVQQTATGLDDSAFAAAVQGGDAATNPYGPVGADLVRPGTPDTIRTIATNATANVIATGSVAQLPAGNVSAVVAANLASRASRSDGTHAGLWQESRIGAESALLRGNLTLPIASRRRDVLGALGDLSINFAAGHEHLSGVGDATSFDAGATWAPVPPLRLTATIARNQGLPPIAQRANPIIETPNVPIFDFATGESVAVARLDGGNPALLAESRNVFSLAGQLRPWPAANVSLNVGYVRSTTRNLVGALPAATPEIEAAFPDRFERDADGTLQRIDVRPVNFARAEQETIGVGLFATLPIGRGRPSGPARPADAQPGSDAAADDENVEGDAPARAGRGRILFALSHNWQLRDQLVIRDNLAPLDFLAGSAFGERAGSRHRVNARINLAGQGLGASLDANWQSGARLVTGASDLSFSSLATFDLKLFADLGARPDLVAGAPWLRGTRISFSVANLLGDRVRVRDAFGETPLSFRGEYLDPLGRIVRLTLRKQI